MINTLTDQAMDGATKTPWGGFNVQTAWSEPNLLHGSHGQKTTKPRPRHSLSDTA